MISRINIRSFMAIALVALSLGRVVAQEPTFTARFEPDSVRVGDRVEYVIDIELDRATEIGLPIFGTEQDEATAMAKRSISTYEEYDQDIFELVEDYDIDTVAVEGRELHLRKRYRLAVMESGLIPMRPTILYFDKNRDVPDTLYSADTIVLRVAGFEELDTTLFLTIDTATMQLQVDSRMAQSKLRDEGVNTQKDLPFIFDEIRDYVIWGAVALILLALFAWWLVGYVRRRRAMRRAKVRVAPKLPPHVVANKALVELGHKKLWQNGKFKPYYTALTSILRVYISERWNIGALEMTSDEIIEALRDVEMPAESRTNLIAVLRTADMVKFAKAEPEAEINEINFTHAFYFVENTKKVSDEHKEGKRDITIETSITD